MNKDKKTHKKEGSQSKSLSPRELDPQGTSVKSTRRKLISVKLKKFLNARPSQDDLYDRKILPYGNATIPLKMSIFNKIVVAFENSNAINSEGIFRISGNSENIRNLNNSLLTTPDFSASSPHDIAGVMKLYIRELPQPLIPYEHFQALLDSQKLDTAQCVASIQRVVQAMPEENRQVLKALVSLLEKVALNNSVNKMTIHNLSVCFGPNVMKNPKDGADVLNEIDQQCAVVACIVENRAIIFGDPQLQSLALPSVPPRPHGNTNAPLPNGLSSPSTTPPTLPSRASRRMTALSNLTLPLPSTKQPPSPTSPASLQVYTPPPQQIPPTLRRRAQAQPQAPPPLLPVAEQTTTTITEQPTLAEQKVASPTSDYESLSMGLIDDLCEEDKSSLAKKIAYYFATEGDQFKVFLKELVGIDGVIALLESVV